MDAAVLFHFKNFPQPSLQNHHSHNSAENNIKARPSTNKKDYYLLKAQMIISIFRNKEYLRYVQI